MVVVLSALVPIWLSLIWLLFNSLLWCGGAGGGCRGRGRGRGRGGGCGGGGGGSHSLHCCCLCLGVVLVYVRVTISSFDMVLRSPCRSHRESSGEEF